MSELHKGSCNCGAIRFETEATPRGVIYCHCSQCRKQSGHYYAATSVPTASLKIHGEELITWYATSSEALRGFCKVCGSALFWRSLGSDDISILAGAFDGATSLSGEKHIFVGDKGDYYKIADGLPQEAQWRRD